MTDLTEGSIRVSPGLLYAGEMLLATAMVASLLAIGGRHMMWASMALFWLTSIAVNANFVWYSRALARDAERARR